ncbi:MAG: Nucleoside permease NupG [Cytophagales bacterium]|jgi:NHS family xanthosine MFS transporter|nr:MAG: Nucleoside permease NupG [Cytophagales bacterium]
MTIRHRLILMNFLEFFVWGSWLISLGGYMFITLKFTGAQVGSIYGTMGVASLFMPALMGIVADRWVNAERVLGMCHLLGAGLLLWASMVTEPGMMYLAILLNSMVYMPTIALNSTVSYKVIEKEGLNIIKDFPPIRVWGTVGFIAAMWVVAWGNWSFSHLQLYISSAAGLLMGIYSFTMPACPPIKNKAERKSLISSLGLDAFVLFRKKRMAIFFVFAMLLGAALQITNTFGSSFLGDFSKSFPNSFVVNYPLLVLSISQISESLFILTIPYFLIRFGIKRVMLISIFAWVFRFGLFAIGNPGSGLTFLILSMIIYGMAFDFFNISGSLFVEREADKSIMASAQGLFMLMTNGAGAFLGGMLSGLVVDYFTVNGAHDWPKIWFCFSGYALILGLAFPLVFKYKHRFLAAPSH